MAHSSIATPTLERNTSASAFYSNFHKLTALNSQNLGDAILQLQGTNNDALKKLLNFYTSCMNSDVSTHTISLMKFLAKIGGWPLLGISDETLWSLNGNQFLQEKLLGSRAFFNYSVQINPTDRTKRMIYVQNSGLTIPALYYSNSSYRNQLATIIANILYRVNPNIQFSYYLSAANGIVSVEQALAELSLNISSQDYIITNLGYVGSLWTDYLWVQQTSVLFNAIGINGILQSEPVVLHGRNYFLALGSTLRAFSSQNILNYAKWQIFYSWIPYLSTNIVDAFYEFKRLINPLTQIPNTRNEYCIEFLHSAMPYALGRVFAENILLPNSKDTAAQMMTNVMQEFRSRISSLSWLDQQTISVAQNKIDMMLTNIAYPNQSLNDTWLNMIYANLTVTDSFQYNVDSYLTDKTPSHLVLLRQPFDKWDTITPTTVNAFYLPWLNEIYILEGIMRVPFFNPTWPLYFQYGSLGSILGHEITHGFDNNGRQYNAIGHRENTWTQYSISNFVSRQQCFIDEYSNLTLFGITNNGTNTLPENIADNGGLRSSYKAYQMAKHKSGGVSLLPGLTNYTDEQLFFIAYGQLWCSYLTPDAVNHYVMNDVHSPAPLRVKGTLKNSVEFADAFACQTGSPMNPILKCSLW